MKEDYDFSKNVKELSSCVVKSFEEPLKTHRRGVIGKITLIIKRGIVVCTRFLLKPYAEKLYNFQINMLNILERLVDNQLTVKSQVDRSTEEYLKLKDQIKNYAEKLAHIENKLEKYDSNNETNKVISNGTISVSEVNIFNKKILAVTLANANDPITLAIKQGRMDIEEQLFSLFKKPGVFLDVGANIGALSLSLAANGWKGYAFEASSKNVSVLNKSILLNDFDVKLIETAVYDKTGEIYFLQNGPYGWVQNELFGESEYEKINSITLDDWMDSNKELTRVDFVKMDIEGSEPAAFRGMSRFLEKFNYPAIFVESNTYTLSIAGETPKSLLTYAKKLGYEAYTINDNRLYTVTQDRFPERIVEDFLFIKASFHNINFPVVESEDPSEDEVISRIINWLDLAIAFNTGGGGYSRDLNGAECSICYVLKDYPKYYEHPSIKVLLLKLFDKRNTENMFVKKCTDWVGKL